MHRFSLLLRSRRRALAATVPLLLASVVLAACGSDDEKDTAASDSGAASLVPANAIAYGEVLLRPDGEVEEGVVVAARRVLGVEDVGRELRRLLDEGVDGERGLYTREVDPWLGDTVAGFGVVPAGGSIEAPDGAAIVAVRDRDAAEAFIARSVDRGELRRGGTYEGAAYDVDEEDGTYVGFVEDSLVIGTPEGFRSAVVASRGDRSLADDEEYETAVGRLAEDRLAWAYLDPAALLPLIREEAMSDPTVGDAFDEQQLRDVIGDEPVTMAMTARADQIVVDVTAGSQAADSDDAGELSVEDLPGDAWMGLATPVLGGLIGRSLRESGQYDLAARQVRDVTALDLDADLLSWLGGIGAFVRGTSPLDLGGGIVIGSGDPAASQRFVTRMERIVGGLGLPTTPTTGGGRGFQVKIPDFPQPIVVLAEDDKVVIGLGLASTRDALDPEETLEDSEPGKSAIESLGDGFEPSLVLVPEPLLTLLRAVGVDDDPDFQTALPYLMAYRSIVIGSASEDGRTTGRLVLNLQDREPATP